jgi:hypothetical protein
MNNLTRNKLLIGMVALILVMNLALAITIYRHVSTERKVVADSTSSGYLCRQLSFNPDQLSGYEKQKDVFFHKADSLRLQIGELRQLLASELEKENPDEAVLKQLSASTGQIYSQLTLQTALHFHEMGKLCTPEQKAKLMDTYRTTGIKDPGQQGGGRQYRHRHGQRNNR